MLTGAASWLTTSRFPIADASACLVQAESTVVDTPAASEQPIALCKGTRLQRSGRVALTAGTLQSVV